MKRSKVKHQKNKKFSRSDLYKVCLGLFLALVGLYMLVQAVQVKQEQRSDAAAPAGDLATDRTNLSFTANNYTSTYHLYAAGLDWNKPVGLMMYTDGSGENGLKNPTGDYLMGGPTGIIAVAKKHNMVLVTPLSPNKACADGDGSCWYEGDPPGYAKYAEALVKQIESQYSIDKKCIAVGGYSSGATFTMGYWLPSGAAQNTMDAGVLVALSEGPGPGMNEVAYTPAFKSNVNLYWNVGDQDELRPDAQEGYDHYTKAGFKTVIDVIPGMSHDRNDDYGKVMDAQITKHLSNCGSNGGTASSSSTGSTQPTAITPTYVCEGSCPVLVSPAPPAGGSSSSPPTAISQPAPVTIPTDVDTNGNNQGFLGIIMNIMLLFLKLLAGVFGG